GQSIRGRIYHYPRKSQKPVGLGGYVEPRIGRAKPRETGHLIAIPLSQPVERSRHLVHGGRRDGMRPTCYQSLAALVLYPLSGCKLRLALPAHKTIEQVGGSQAVHIT